MRSVCLYSRNENKGDCLTMKHNRRRLFSVVSSLQYRFLAMTLIYCFVIVCFLAVATFAPDILKMQDQNLKLETRSYAAHRFLDNHSWMWGAVLLFIAAFGVHSFCAFHKIMGPLHRFRWAFEQLGNGNLLLRIEKRKNDYLETEVEALNNMAEALSRKLRIIKDATEAASKSMGELEQSMNEDNGGYETQRDLLRALREHFERLSTAIQVFRLEDGEQSNPLGSGCVKE
jgi:methyl-accepting chemotaxis protein